MEFKSIPDLVREVESNDRNGSTTLSKYVQVSMREDIETTEAYLNSKFTSGDTDALGRLKPFFNIVIGMRNIVFRATDIDRKNIVVRATKNSDVVAAFLATIKLQEWMKQVNFGQFLNDWGLTLASHGSAITKFIEKEGKLFCKVMDWNTMLVDPIDFENNVKIEKLWFTPAQLRKQKGYNQKLVKKLLENLQARTTQDGQTKDQKAGYIPVYEVHGELSLAQYKNAKGESYEDADNNVFFQQMHVISFIPSDDTFDDYSLYEGREAKDPYMITHLLKKDGQTYSGGTVKEAFDAQVMVNASVKQIKDQLDLASKIIFQTTDKTFAGRNALKSIENGDILTTKLNEPITQLNNKPDIAAMQSFQASWQQNAAQIKGISEAMMGENAPSGTAWRQVQALLQESHSLFETYTENKGLEVIRMFTTYIIDHFKKQLDNSDEIAGTLEDYQIKQIDAMFLPNEVTRRINERKKQVILSGQIYDPGFEAADMAQAEAELKGLLTGNQRFIKPSDVKKATWKEVFKDLEWKLDIDVTGEAKDTQGAMATLTTVLQTITTNPAVLQDPNVKLVFNKILGLAANISPLELNTTQAQPAPAMAAPQVAAPVPQPA